MRNLAELIENNAKVCFRDADAGGADLSIFGEFDRVRKEIPQDL